MSKFDYWFICICRRGTKSCFYKEARSFCFHRCFTKQVINGRMMPALSVWIFLSIRWICNHEIILSVVIAFKSVFYTSFPASENIAELHIGRRHVAVINFIPSQEQDGYKHAFSAAWFQALHTGCAASGLPRSRLQHPAFFACIYHLFSNFPWCQHLSVLLLFNICRHKQFFHLFIFLFWKRRPYHFINIGKELVLHTVIAPFNYNLA